MGLLAQTDRHAILLALAGDRFCVYRMWMIDDPTQGRAAALIAHHELAAPSRQSGNVQPQGFTVTKDGRAAIKRQTPRVLWFTGLSGAGKSTIANLVEVKLHQRGLHTMMLDGDNIRCGLNRDLGFTEEARVENIRRVAEVAALMTQAGLIVLCCFISPFATDRQAARAMMAPGEFIEIHVHATIEAVIARDPKGLYKRALAGKIDHFTGLGQRYEAPAAPELFLDTTKDDAETLADRVVSYLETSGAIEPSRRA